MIYDRKNLNTFIVKHFEDEDLWILCSVEFPDVYDDFSIYWGKKRKVIELVLWCERNGQKENLVAVLQRERPQEFQEFFGYTIAVEATVTIPVGKRNPHQIFISHAQQDCEFAQQLAKDLRDEGWQTWLAQENIQPGEKWVEAINRGLSESGVFVLVSTPDAVASAWVSKEMNAAIALETQSKICLFPLALKPTQMLPLWTGYQWIDFEKNYDIGLTTLFNALENWEKKALIEDHKEVVSYQPEQRKRQNVLHTALAKIKFHQRTVIVTVFVIALFVLMIIIWPDSDGRQDFDLAKVEKTEIIATEVVAAPSPAPASIETVTPEPVETESSALMANTTPTAISTPTKTSIPITPNLSPTATAANCSDLRLRVVSQSVNVRKGPDISHDSMGIALHDQEFSIIASNRSRSWYIIQFSEDKVGWIAASEVEIAEACDEEIPVAATIPASPTPESTPTLQIEPPTQTPPISLPPNTPIPTKPLPDP